MASSPGGDEMPATPRATHVARTAAVLSKLVLAAALVTAPIAFLTMLNEGLAGIASVTDCCAPPPTAPRLSAFVRWLEIICSIAIGLGIAALVERKLRRPSLPGARSVAFSLVFGTLALGLAVATDLWLP
jgi:hypothetical protein